MDEDMRTEYETYEEAGFKSKAQQDFWNKSIPVLLIGFIIWGVTSFVFSEFGFSIDMITYIILIILYISTWIVTIVLAYKNKNFYAMMGFLVATFLTGLITAPLFGYMIYFFGMTDTARLFLISTSVAASTLTGCYFIGWIARKKGYESRNYGLLLLGAGILILILEPVVFIVGGGFNLFYMIFSLIIIGWMYATGIWYGMLLEDEMKQNAWMYFVIGYFLTLVNIIVRMMRILSYFR